MNLDQTTVAETKWSKRDLLGVFGLMAFGVVVTWDAWRDIIFLSIHDEEQSHVLLVPIIVAWLIWVRRGRLRRCPRDGRLLGPLIVAGGWFLHSFGDLRLVQAFWHLGAITVVAGCFLSFSGKRYLLRLMPAFLGLALMVPVPGMIRHQIALPLQTWTAEATLRALDVLGVEAIRVGNALVINGKQILVAEACNGLRMAFALFLVSFTFAYTVPIREPIRLLIIVLSPLTAIICNVIRLVPTVWVHGYVSEEAGQRLHDVGGWAMLPVAFLLLMGVFRTLRWALVPVYRYTLAYGK